jgi:CubicO group peptidase (beta-lactamase class C family)
MDSLFSALPVTEAVSEPGVAYRYSNVGYAILGAAISRAAKKPFVDYVRANVIRALGMTSNRLRAVGGNAIAADDRVDYDVLVKDSLNYDDAADSHRNGVGLGVAVGALYSTVGDLAKLVSLELGFGPDSVLSAAASASARCRAPRGGPDDRVRIWPRYANQSVERHDRDRPFRQRVRIYVADLLRSRAGLRRDRVAERRWWTSGCKPAGGSRVSQVGVARARSAAVRKL